MNKLILEERAHCPYCWNDIAEDHNFITVENGVGFFRNKFVNIGCLKCGIKLPLED